METVLSILVLTLALPVIAIPCGVVAAGIASGTDKWESEDQALEVWEEVHVSRELGGRETRNSVDNGGLNV
jgi:hypothetical protein